MLLRHLCIIMLVLYTPLYTQPITRNLAAIKTPHDLTSLFPRNAAYIEAATDAYLDEITQRLAEILSVPDAERTFENTIKAFDYCMSLSDAAIFKEALLTITSLHPQADMREAATIQVSRIQASFIDIRANKALYNALKAYAMHNAYAETLTTEQRYFLETIIADFKRAGLDLPDAQLDRVRELNKEINDLALAFNHTIDSDKSSIIVSSAELQGVSNQLLAQLKQNGVGDYIVGMDAPTVAQVASYCQVPETRKKLFIAFKNRAYPENDQLLCKLIAKRHELARLLGFTSYAALDLDNQMVKSPERATAFIRSIIERSALKAEQEFKEFAAHLPADVTLSPDGKLYPWDYAYLKTHIKNLLYNIDEQAIAEYFPVDHTLQGMLDIYAQFFSLRFEAQTINGLWIDGLTLLTIYTVDGTEPLGYVILDLYPRDNKYGHAACQSIIPATYLSDGKATCAVAQVMANFPQAHEDKPALFKLSDVTTFFHEFGHALHAVLGRTALASQAGLAIKVDFAEMPSQMLEEWMHDTDIIKNLSCHYATHEQLPDDLINNIRKLNHFDSGSWIQQQCFYAMASLQFFGAQQPISHPDELWHSLSEQIRVHDVAVPDDHMYTSFWHLTEYGSKYYGYLWSKVFALDLFYEIKRHGLLNPIIGKQYVQEVIGRGASAEPDKLLVNFLGRKPTDEAFFTDMGI